MLRRAAATALRSTGSNSHPKTSQRCSEECHRHQAAKGSQRLDHVLSLSILTQYGARQFHHFRQLPHRNQVLEVIIFYFGLRVGHLQECQIELFKPLFGEAEPQLSEAMLKSVAT
jgi:hypothetical protein